jgi:hypothetical protein
MPEKKVEGNVHNLKARFKNVRDEQWFVTKEGFISYFTLDSSPTRDPYDGRALNVLNGMHMAKKKVVG